MYHFWSICIIFDPYVSFLIHIYHFWSGWISWCPKYSWSKTYDKLFLFKLIQQWTKIYFRMKSITPTPKYKFESETSKAVRQIVNGCKLYPKALTMQVDNEVKFDKQRKSQKSAKKAAASPASISASVPVDQTLSYGDWKILEPGNFGSQPHFLDGFVSPSRLPSLNDRLGENNIIENEYYRTRSTLSESLSPSTSSEEC